MAVGVLPGQFESRQPKLFVDSDFSSASPTLNTPPSPLESVNSNSSRPFFWEVVPLCDLYSVAHVILLPSSLRVSYDPVSSRHGLSGANAAVKGADGVNRHQPHPETSRFLDALADLGLGQGNSATAGVSVFTAILPSTDGYASQSDFLRLRLLDFPFPISKIQETLRARQKYSACRPSPSSANSEDYLASLIEQAAGVIQWADLESSVSILDLQQYLLGLTHELRDRLNNAPWLTPHPIARKRAALIRGRPNLTAGGPVYRAARALGLDLVIIDDESHWLQPDTDDNRMHREAFLATDMTEDAGLVDRILASIARYPLPIHGVFTLSDNFFVTTALVADALGLPTNPVSAFQTSVDKHRSRLLQDPTGSSVARVSSVEELDALLLSSAPAAFSPVYPLIVKPTKGWSSECVSKVTSPRDLAAAVAKATARHGSAAVIEPFFDGPEIDANFVLLDGEVLFFEVADEPPCQADGKDAGVEATFSPEALTLPSALPGGEQETVRETLRGLLVKAGFRTGVFHVEARVVGSGTEYLDVGEGVVDLVVRHHDDMEVSKKAECKLVEINARPPGYRVSVPSRHTYGVDFFAVHMLAAVGDHDRLRLAARSFDHAAEGRTRGAQYWSRLVYVPAPKEGVVRWPSGLSPCEELKKRRPDLKERIMVAVDYCVPGDRIGMYTDGARTYVAHLLVCSRVSRRDTIEMGDDVLRAIQIEVEEE
ncbi:glutathione synthetase ATP-binding domain-like protein [Parathielavia hyrcaniae]|uniref:Glutathione synthetase ATP-binding domain-like protein n=1 Tax=Parathielavia hyrcaniae TaxID=113614 RepID=A0AAN6T559_9PEZI|nr:glutathione synthetase ATP-binding domain-like protein [Parathielavia hyrcaniae]